MTTKPKAKSRIFEAVHETARDLHRLGFIDKRKMRKFDVLCLDPIPAYDSEKIRALRDHSETIGDVPPLFSRLSNRTSKGYNGNSFQYKHRRPIFIAVYTSVLTPKNKAC